MLQLSPNTPPHAEYNTFLGQGDPIVLEKEDLKTISNNGVIVHHCV